MKPALLLIDMQLDFLGREGLSPAADEIVSRVGQLLELCRTADVPVLHVHTLVGEDGEDRMPHWIAADVRACVIGSKGAQPPDELMPIAGEALIAKRFFSAFGNPDLEQRLSALQTDTLILAGIYTHGCIRATALDAYERGYRVIVASDATGSTDELHAEITRDYLEQRAASFMTVQAATTLIHNTPAPTVKPPFSLPVACIGNVWVNAGMNHSLLNYTNPCRSSEQSSVVPVAGADEVDGAVSSALHAFASWSVEPATQRTEFLSRWMDVLIAQKDALVEAIVGEIGKPVTDAREEYGRALQHIETAIDLATRTEEPLADGVSVRYRPRGVIGIVTPWNNPIAITIGKLAPAIGFGNVVVWKPAPQAMRTSILLMETLITAGLPAGVINMLAGDADTARLLLRHADISAVSLTGSMATGRIAAALCAISGKPLQAELGGNNAAIVMPGADLKLAASDIARAAFGFSGQRCTAIRRMIVEHSILDEFLVCMGDEVDLLALGDPADEHTVIGPLVSPAAFARVQRAVDEAIHDGATLLRGGKRPAGFEQGCWFEPTLLSGVEPHWRIAREETFGPVAVVMVARDIDDALRIANDVPHGLVAGLWGGDESNRKIFLRNIEAGIVRLAPTGFRVHQAAPFGGWKASGIGMPEHGIWDREFYTRPQALYHSDTRMNRPD